MANKFFCVAALLLTAFAAVFAAPIKGERGGLCIQVIACCRKPNGALFEATTPCACKDEGGTVLDYSQCSSPALED